MFKWNKFIYFCKNAFLPVMRKQRLRKIISLVIKWIKQKLNEYVKSQALANVLNKDFIIVKLHLATDTFGVCICFMPDGE